MPEDPGVARSGSVAAFVVCVGSSAGGLAALTGLLGGLSADLPCCYVIAQHVSPDQHSVLAELLARDTTLAVRVAVDGAVLVGGLVLVVPPDAEATVDAGAVRLSGRASGVGPSPSADGLLGSAARSWGAAAIGVVLSGTGRDGAAGGRAVREAGGATIAQEPSSAQFAEMPQAAIATGVVDLIRLPAEVGAALRRLTLGGPDSGAIAGADDRADDTAEEVTAEGSAGGTTAAAARAGRTDEGGSERATAWDVVGQVVSAVRSGTGIDFSGYKRTSVVRQIERRMAARQIGDLAGYRDVVAGDRAEAQALVSTLLVPVTSFFRDPDAWRALRDPLAEVLAGGRGGEREEGQVRIWVPGCATGPEPYSVAMIVAELLGHPEDLARRVKVFATDLNEAALQTARDGRYPDDAVAAIPERMRRRWLRRIGAGDGTGGGGWEIVPALRECLVFARHNVALDPPFPKIDLVSLRNTLIYFDTALQERVLRLLHFSLVPGGLLLLGESERVLDSHELFETVDATDRIYRRRPATTAGLLPAPQLRPAGPPAVPRVPAARPGGDRDRLREALISGFVPPSLVLAADDHVVEVVGDVSRWCQVTEGRHSSHVQALVRPVLRATVRSLVLTARGSVSSVQRAVALDGDAVVLTARRLTAGSGGGPGGGSSGFSPEAGWVVLSFTDPAVIPGPAGGAEPPGRGLASSGVDGSPGGGGLPAEDERNRMVTELASTEAALQATIEQLSTSNEELQALNEELQAAAEELQASNEEVRASNEELEATNEELSSLNAELQRRGEDLARANTDLENIQTSLTSGLVLVDRELRVMRYTPLAVRLFALIESDVGRPLPVIPSTLDIPDLEVRLRAAVHDHRDGLLELRGERTDMLLAFHPYRAGDGTVRGAIVVCTDISEIATAHRVAQQRLRDLVAVTEALRETVWQRGDDGGMLFLNSQVERLYGLSRSRVVEDPGLLLAAVHPQDRERVALASAAVPDQPVDLEYRILRPDGELRSIHQSITPVPADDIGPAYTVSSALDVTDRREAQRRLAEQLATLEAVFDNSAFGVILLDADERVLRANDVFARMSGIDRDAMVGMPVQLAAHEPDQPDDGGDHDDHTSHSGGAGGGVVVPAGFARTTVGLAHRRLVSRDGTPYFVTVEARPLDADGDARQIVVVHDVTRLQQANDELARRARYDQHTGLPNRDHFRARLATELARAARTESMLAVLWVDLDGFKEVNDRYGHQAGDDALREISARLQRLIRGHDAVGRLGGDEFAILITDVDPAEDLDPVTARVLSSLHDPIQLRDAQVHLSGSVGVAVAPADGEDPDALLHHADTAMYAAKQAGKDRRAYFRPEMNQAAEARAGIRQHLAEALRARQFVMHYQPIIDVRTGEVRAVEALVRWVRDDTVVPAGEFVTVAAQTGQLRALGALTLDLIDADLHVLRRDVPGLLPVCVNVSPAQLEERDTIDRLLAWEPAGGMGGLVIEVTEAAALARGGRAADTLTLLARLGARLSVDDFGTGYSTLALLDRLRPSLIKIDRTLLTGALDQPRGAAVLRAAVQLAHALDAEVVIEGVGDEQLWTLTRTLPAEQAQGFHLAAPMALTDLLAWLDTRH